MQQCWNGPYKRADETKQPYWHRKTYGGRNSSVQTAPLKWTYSLKLVVFGCIMSSWAFNKTHVTRGTSNLPYTSFSMNTGVVALHSWASQREPTQLCTCCSPFLTWKPTFQQRNSITLMFNITWTAKETRNKRLKRERPYLLYSLQPESTQRSQ